jgi:tRNA (cytidine/uridine-2'-O-)-methyltransferase
VLHVILFQPAIPPNTGNIIRLSANTGCILHLVRPLGFSLDRKSVRRAGLDYDELAAIRQHAGIEDCLGSLGDTPVFSIETSGRRLYSDARIPPEAAFLFGNEHHGLPESVLSRIAPDHQLRLPMRPGNRSLNLSNAAAIVVYEAWRQNGYTGATLP